MRTLFFIFLYTENFFFQLQNIINIIVVVIIFEAQKIKLKKIHEPKIFYIQTFSEAHKIIIMNFLLKNT
jgi:hypothetical protein